MTQASPSGNKSGVEPWARPLLDSDLVVQYSVRNRRRLKQTGTTPALATPADQARTDEPSRTPTPTVVEARLGATPIERARE
jgi:hypothetical protein